MYDVIFYILAAITVIPAFVVVFSRNIAYSAFSLMFTFFGVSGLYVMLGADFVGVSQLLIYVGGILVLFLFGMMLTSNIDQLNQETTPMARQFGAALTSSALAAALIAIVWDIPAWTNATPAKLPNGAQTTSTIGTLFMGDYALLFIASAVAILVALVGAAMIARADRLAPEEAATRL
jgi:NADH-quinone oxidoreductase subunit J